MGLFVSTVSTSVVVPELGITIVHPITDMDIGSQFSSDELSAASSLTTAILAGTLVWRKTAGGAIETPSTYDPDFLETEELRVGSGSLLHSKILRMDPSIQATANSIKTLTLNSESLQIFTGTTAGQRVNLPSATTLLNGHIYEVWNFSNQKIDIRNTGGAILATLNANGRTQILLRDNSSANGLWGLTYTLDNGNVFGTNIIFVQDDAEISNNSNSTWANRLVLTTPSTLPLGDYLMNFQFIWRSSAVNREADFRFQLNNVDEVAWSPSTSRIQDRQLLSGFRKFSAISGVNTVNFDFKVLATSTTIYVSSARMFLWRVA